MRSTLLAHPATALLLALASLSGCRTPESGAEPQAPGDAPVVAITDVGELPDAAAGADAPTREVIEALLAGDLDRAEAGLDGLLVERARGRALAAIEAGAPADALVSIDELLDAAHPDAVRMKAEASLALAEKTITEGGNGLLIQGALDDARRYFDRLESKTTEDLLGGSRAAWLLSDAAGAADRAALALDLVEADEDADDVLVTRTYQAAAQSSYGAYVGLKQANENPDAIRVRFDQTESALSTLLGRTPSDPWVWTTLCDLYAWEGMGADARAIAERGIEKLPTEEALWDRLARVARNSGGRTEAAVTLDAVSESIPNEALGHWYRGWERFQYAVETMGEEIDVSDDYRAAERAFQLTAELDEARADEARGYAVMCRAGLGWCAYYKKDWDAAALAFKSMNDVLDGGVTWELKDRVGSGLLGLAIVVKQLGDAGRLEAAGDLSAELYELTGSAGAPKEPVHANNAGFYLRDAGIALEARGQALCALARGSELADDERAALLSQAGLAADADADALRAAANAHLERAHSVMKKSGEQYLIAAAGMPEDVRVVNDAALVHVYYLYDNLPWAEEQLMRMIEVGERQLADPELVDQARFEVENAWGDVYQNLGVLWASLKKSPADALPFFERSVEIGPEPRPMVTQLWIPFVKGELEPDASFAPLALARWGQACTE